MLRPLEKSDRRVRFANSINYGFGLSAFEGALKEIVKFHKSTCVQIDNSMDKAYRCSDNDDKTGFKNACQLVVNLLKKEGEEYLAYAKGLQTDIVNKIK